jgi:hypothetical protein
MSDDLEALAAEAYVYGFPLVFDLEMLSGHMETAIIKAGPFNTFSHASRLAGPDDRFVSVNNDTIYSIAGIDVSGGPVLLQVPDTAGRYYVLQFVDAWTDNFAYVGTRSTGQDAGEFLIVPPGWRGDAGDAQVIHAPTRIVSIVGRWACADADDLPAVHALQDALSLTPLDADAVVAGLPAVASEPDAAIAFWEKYRVWSQAFPPASRDEPLQASFAALGLTGDRPVAELDESLRRILRHGYEAGVAALDRLAGGGDQATVNGWSQTVHVFDYNLDFFDVGAVDDPAWQITDPLERLATRAVAAKAGLWGNHGYEAAYLMTHVDADGEPLDGAHDYELHLTPAPPVDAFWSVTMYSLPDFYLVPNEIDRYSVGDRTPGIVRDSAGGLRISIGATRPADPDAAANWLPAPTGRFRPILRMYMPGAAVLDGSYAPPAITRLR